jgi:hypothetical protein
MSGTRSAGTPRSPGCRARGIFLIAVGMVRDERQVDRIDSVDGHLPLDHHRVALRHRRTKEEDLEQAGEHGDRSGGASRRGRR